MNVPARWFIMGVAMLSVSENLVSGPPIYQPRSRKVPPLVASDTYWDTHHICLVRVVAVGKNEAGKEQITFEVTQRISEGPGPDTKSVSLGRFWFGTNPFRRPRIEKDDFLVVFIKKRGPALIAATKLDTPPDQSPLMKRLVRIAQLRANVGGIEALSEGVFDDDAQVARYCLARMSTREPLDVPNYVSRLRVMRNEESRDARVRLLAGALANRLEGKRDDSDLEYRWLQSAISQSKQADFTHLRRLVDRLLEFDERRHDTTTFLTQLVGDGKARTAVRNAAQDPFSDPRLFVFTKPDGDSERVFEACVSLLEDPDADMRRSGAHLLRHVCNGLTNWADPATSRKYVDRATASIAAAISVEKDESCNYHMKEHLKEIRERAAPKP